MKELSIEEKAKRYDEAIEKAKYYYDEGKTLEYANDIVSDIFPELKETEDERIRKKLIEAVKGDMVVGGTKDKQLAISWLEKQGEQRPIIVPKFMVGDFIKLKDSDETYEVSKIEIFDTDEIYYHLTNGGCVCENVDNFELVKQKPQGKSALEAAKEEKVYNQNCVKPADKVEPKFKVGDIIKATEDGEVFTIRTITKDKYIYTDDSFDWIKDQDEYELVEQKPTDEEMKELLHTEYEKGKADAIEEMQNHTWSEEDCNQIETIACHLDNIGNEAMAESLLNIMNKYKSLRPQKQWKPSNKQLEALEHAINCYSGISPTNTEEVYTLEIMKEQLKKLREG